MNIYLIPYTWIRHLSTGLVLGGAAVFAWWVYLTWLVLFGPTLFEFGLLWTSRVHGAYFLAAIGTTISFMSILVEGALYRRPLHLRLGKAALAGLLTLLLSLIAFWVVGQLTWLFVSAEHKPLYDNVGLVTYRYRWMQWWAVGWATAIGPLAVRRFSGFIYHLMGGVGAAGIAGALWHFLAYQLLKDYYLSAAIAAFSWGFLFGVLVWPIPRELYAGWLRVLSDYRYGYRIPIDHVDGSPSERFVGHFPRGLDLFLPVEQGIAELHVSALVDSERSYAIRGLSQWPAVVKRMLERIDIRYDARRPAPLETELEMEDKIILSNGRDETVLEFLLLPKEEA